MIKLCHTTAVMCMAEWSCLKSHGMSALTVESRLSTNTASSMSGSVYDPQPVVFVRLGSTTASKLPLPVKLAVVRYVPLLVRVPEPVLPLVSWKLRAIPDSSSNCVSGSQ